jgi:hypothetical protein
VELSVGFFAEQRPSRGARLWLSFNPLLVARHVERPWLVDLAI